MAKQQRQVGRPIKKVPKGERTQVGVIIGGDTKALLLKAMKESGRTISREVEHLIEKALWHDQLMSGEVHDMIEVVLTKTGNGRYRIEPCLKPFKTTGS